MYACKKFCIAYPIRYSNSKQYFANLKDNTNFQIKAVNFTIAKGDSSEKLHADSPGERFSEAEPSSKLLTATLLLQRDLKLCAELWRL